jgi:hypothetical protein
MSQHNIACFHHLFQKNTADFISTSSRMIWAVFLPLDAVFHINFHLFCPFHQLGSIECSKYLSYLDDFIPVLKPALSAGKSL